MRKMILLAAMTAIAALMLAATPALAAPQGKTTICHVPPGNPANAHTITISDNAVDRHLANHPGDSIGPCRDDGNGNGDGRDNDGRDNDGRDNDGRDNDVFPVIELTQDFEQEAESGDIDQDFDVSQTGDNPNQTVGIQGVANTGNAQNQIGVIDAGDFGAFDDNDFNRNDFCEDINNGDDFCEDFNNGDDFCEDFHGDDFCEDLEEFCDDFNGDNICDFFFDDDDNNRFFFDDDDNNRFSFDDDDNNRFSFDDDGDIEFEDVGSTIEVSPTNTVSSDQQVNQAASASG